MNRITNEFDKILNEAKLPFRKEELSDGSTLISNKIESIFHRMTPPKGFFINRPAYFFGNDIGEIVSPADKRSIKTTIKKAYSEYIAIRYNAIVRTTDTLIDKKHKHSMENDNIEMAIIYCDDHTVNNTNVRLKSEEKVQKIIRTKMYDVNRYFGNRLEYIDLEDFVQGINQNYMDALQMLKDQLRRDIYAPTFLHGAIETSFIKDQILFDPLNYDRLVICTMNIRYIGSDIRESIIHQLQQEICNEINGILKDEFSLILEHDEDYIKISVNYMESVSESVEDTNTWGNLIVEHSSYMSYK